MEEGGPMVGALISDLSSLGLRPGQGHYVVFLGRTLYSHSASLHPGVQMGIGKFQAGVTLRWTRIPSRGEK